jgi:hypothetical protein
MTTIKQEIKRENIRQEIREFRKAAKKIASSKESARRFLISTGIYSATGRLKAAYR